MELRAKGWWPEISTDDPTALGKGKMWPMRETGVKHMGYQRLFFKPPRLLKNRLSRTTIISTCFWILGLTFKSHPWFMKTKLSCEASFKFQELKIWKRRFRARPPSNSKTWRYENEAFVRGLLQIPPVEEMKTKLSCEAAFKVQQVQKWTHLFNGAVPMHKVSHHMQNTIAQHRQRGENVTWNHQFHCARSSTTFHGKATTPTQLQSTLLSLT